MTADFAKEPDVLISQRFDMELTTIKEKMTTLDNIHESCFRSHSILELVLEMVERGDSKETIFAVVRHLKSDPISKTSASLSTQ